MAHFAELDADNKVLRILAVDNDKLFDANGQEDEQLGIKYLQNIFGDDTRWVQSSFNRKFRKNHATVDGVYDEEVDAFIGPQPYPSWILNIDTYEWEAPKPFPSVDKFYKWNEDKKRWEERV